ncbi:Protein N-acetyltransferase, RimJ/RimL family [Bosea sp. CRIB-10]|uniref:GNAT family N-acetyltransferase n=1 Tax=Bosea sp. CRIB-10 TaxID=378404 RepID=UPI0008EF4352|nr:GNAT family N-acetyltransferase [Bosea sp. CRIB-10]SFC58318.1 Protein N-acetyltransferase, RimJ/RimL family [Bosea sp. CRIB-10]
MIHASQLETARLVVRPFVQADAPLLVALFADPEVHRFVDDGQALAPDVAALWVERSAANLERFGYGTGAVVERAGGEVIGWAGFARPGDGTEELIYGLRRASWGRGLGKELLAGLVAFAAERGISPVRATVDPANSVSVHLLRQAGFALAEPRYRGDAQADLYLHGG